MKKKRMVIVIGILFFMILTIQVSANIDVGLNNDNLAKVIIDGLSEIFHNALEGLQGGSPDEFYHLNQSTFNSVIANGTGGGVDTIWTLHADGWIINDSGDLNFDASLLNISTWEKGVSESEILFNYGNQTFEGVIKNKEDQHDNNTNNLIFAIFSNGTSGATMPHFWIQDSGPEKASGITRSFMVVNEYINVQNTTNLTDCRSYMDFVNESLMIDCNTSITGADILVGDDMQVVGDVWFKDTEGEWHFSTRELQLRDLFYKNIFFNKINSSLDGSVYTFSDDESFVLNILSNETILNTSNASGTLNVGTSGSPELNYVHYLGNPPELTVTTSKPENAAEVARILVGGNDNVYASISGITDNEEFFRKLFGFAIDIGPLYVDGFDTSSSQDDVNFTEGTMSILLNRKLLNNVSMLDDGFFFVKNDGTFVQSTSLEDITEYSDGGSIGNNKFYNVVVGIAHSDVSNSRMFFTIQSTPSSEYSNLQDAEVDKFDSVNFFPSNIQLQNAYIPISRLIIKKQGGADEFQLLSNGLFHFNERGITSKAGAAATPSITKHNQLENLEWNESSHTFNNENQDFNIGSYNFTTQGNVSIGKRLLFGFGEMIDNIIDGILKLTSNLEVTGNINVTGTNSSFGSFGIGENATTIILDGGGKDICIGSC